jgi:uncharacterized RDD family membrane protein YckC
MTSPSGYYAAQGDPPGTVRYWDGAQWTTQPMPAPPGFKSDAPDQRFAEVWVRIGALLLDSVITMIVLAPVMIFWLIDVFRQFDEQRAAGETTFRFETSTPSSLLLAGLIVAVLQMVMIAYLGGTPGKLMVGLRITTDDGATTPPGLSRAFRRMLPAFVGIVPYIGGLIGIGFMVMSLVWVNTDPERRSAYDRFAGTRVVRKSHL